MNPGNYNVGGYPQQGMGVGGYPQQPGMMGVGGYPQQQGMMGVGGYPQQQGMMGVGGYPQQQGMTGVGGYPQQQGMMGVGGYPQQGMMNQGMMGQGMMNQGMMGQGMMGQGMMGQGMMNQGMMGQGMMGQGMMGQGMGMMTGANIQNDVQMLRKAMKGLGTDENTIINIISHRSWQERLQIKLQYSSTLGRDLIKDFKSELSGKLEDTVLALFDTPAEFDAKCLYKAMHGIGTDNEVLIEIIGTRSAYELQNIKNAFMQLYQKDLVSKVESETSGHFRKILVAILQCQRHDNSFMVDQNLCQNEAQQLYQAGQGRWGTDEGVFTRIFAQKSSMELGTIANYYQQMTGMSLYQTIEKEFSGNVRELLKAIFYAVINAPEFFATKIHESVSGAGTKDAQLIRIIVSRAEIDMDQIKTAYYRLYNRDMLGDIRSDTSSKYKKILTELVMK